MTNRIVPHLSAVAVKTIREGKLSPITEPRDDELAKSGALIDARIDQICQRHGIDPTKPDRVPRWALHLFAETAKIIFTSCVGKSALAKWLYALSTAMDYDKWDKLEPARQTAMSEADQIGMGAWLLPMIRKVETARKRIIRVRLTGRDVPYRQLHTYHCALAAIADMLPLVEEKLKPKPLDELKAFAAAKMKGNGRRIVELVCDGDGRCPIADVALEVDWEYPHKDSCKGALRRINKKLKSTPWKLRQHDGAIIVETNKSE